MHEGPYDGRVGSQINPYDVGKQVVRSSYDTLAEHYDEGYLAPRDIAENELIRRITRPLTSGPVVDLGCGTGLFIDLHNGSVGEYHGFDLSPRMLEHARTKHPSHRFVEHDMDDPWPIEDGRAGSVVSLFAFHYSDTPASAISEMVRVLRPGGRFFLTVCSTRWPKRHSYVEGRDGLHQCLYTAQSARALFDRPEFDDVSVRGLSRWVDHAPSVPLARAVLEAEVATVLRARPDEAFFLMVQGRRTNR